MPCHDDSPRPVVPPGAVTRSARRPPPSEQAIACLRHVSPSSIAISPTCMCAAAIGAGGRAFTIEPSGATTRTACRMPSVNGTSAARIWCTRTTSSERTISGFELKKYGHSAADPV